MTLTDIANGLVERGCRVLLFDLFGRGFSDGVGDLPFDTRLFVSQILLVLASSHLAWAGDDAFSIVGYSLGGGIAVNFAVTFPHMVQSLILLAPAGLIRAENFGRASRLIFKSGLVPEGLLEALTKRRLRTPLAGSVSKKRKMSMVEETVVSNFDGDGKEDFVDVAVQEAVDPNVDRADDDSVDSVHPVEAKIVAYVHWMLDSHDGFVPAFMSTIRYAPLLDQHEYWRKLALRKPGTTAVILGRQDELVQKDDHAEDALPLIGGKQHVFWRIVPGGHNFPFTNPREALEAIDELWGI